MTRAQLQEYVLQSISVDEDDPESELLAKLLVELDAAYQKICVSVGAKRATGSVSLSAGVKTVTLPSDCGRALTIRQGTYVWEPIAEQEMVKQRAALSGVATQTTDVPWTFIVNSETEVELDPAPGASATAEIRYIVLPTGLTSDSSTPDQLPDRFHPAIAEYAIAALMRGEEEAPLAREATAAADRILAEFAQHVAERGGLRRRQRLLRGGIR